MGHGYGGLRLRGPRDWVRVFRFVKGVGVFRVLVVDGMGIWFSMFQLPWVVGVALWWFDMSFDSRPWGRSCVGVCGVDDFRSWTKVVGLLVC